MRCVTLSHPERYRAARRDSQLVVLEGFHALKHALRFGAEVVDAVASDVAAIEKLSEALAPELTSSIAGLIVEVSPGVLTDCAPRPTRTGVLAIARRPAGDLQALLDDARPAPIVLLEDPRTMGNLGACIRVAAAADAAGVLTTGDADPWNADAVRGAAGLHYALPVLHIAEQPPTDRPLIALDPDGTDLAPSSLPPRAILAFGTERHGLSDDLLARADQRIRIPMRPGVSSLNLATAVAAVLFSQRATAPAND